MWSPGSFAWPLRNPCPSQGTSFSQGLWRNQSWLCFRACHCQGPPVRHPSERTEVWGCPWSRKRQSGLMPLANPGRPRSSSKHSRSDQPLGQTCTGKQTGRNVFPLRLHAEMVHPAQMSTRNRCLRTSIQVRNHQVVLRALKIDLKISLRNGEARKEFNITGILGGYFPRGRDKSIETSPGFRSATIPSGIQWQPTFESPAEHKFPTLAVLVDIARDQKATLSSSSQQQTQFHKLSVILHEIPNWFGSSTQLEKKN